MFLMVKYDGDRRITMKFQSKQKLKKNRHVPFSYQI